MIKEIENRHSVRSYKDIPLSLDIKNKLNERINEINEQNSLHFQLVCDEPKAFKGLMAHYGGFKNVSNYIALIGPKNRELDEKCGYFGEKLVLFAQGLGLNTCWVAMTYSKVDSAYCIKPGEKLVMVIALGYGTDAGKEHKTKDISVFAKIDNQSPEWFIEGVKACMKAPTAMNQQKFYLELAGDKVKISMGKGFYTAVDKGIVKCHFEIGAHKGNDCWLS